MVKWFHVLCFICILFGGVRGNARLSDQMAKTTQKCCEKGSAYVKSFYGTRTSDVCSSMPEEMPPDVPAVARTMCSFAMIQCCNSYNMKLIDCRKGVELAQKNKTCVSSSETVENCCTQCTGGIAAGVAAGEASCSRPLSGDLLASGAFNLCCKNAAKTRGTETLSQILSKRRKSKENNEVSICEEYAPNELCAHHCIPVPGSYRCECNPGFKLMPDGRNCMEVTRNRCKSRNPCQHKCIDNGVSIRCACRRGYKLMADGRNCEDIDECTTDPAICLSGTQCVNVQGSYKCIPLPKTPGTDLGQCPSGYTMNQTYKVCDDINECALPNPPCPLSSCENTMGGYKCDGVAGDPKKLHRHRIGVSSKSFVYEDHSVCPPGFKAGVKEECEDVDECALQIDDCNINSQFCINTRGHFYCQEKGSKHCPPGFVINPHTQRCEDINECEDGLDVCKPDQICVNTLGEFDCKPRNKHRGPKPCPEGMRMNKRLHVCEDIDECIEGTHMCDQHQECVNTKGSHECRCKVGFELDPFTGACTDINECATDQHNCIPESQRCDNTVGSYLCVRFTSCGTGYILHHSKSKCEDIDECALGIHNCARAGPDYECMNIPGSFRCVKKSKVTTTEAPEYEYEYYDSEEITGNVTIKNVQEYTENEQPAEKPKIPTAYMSPSKNISKINTTTTSKPKLASNPADSFSNMWTSPKPVISFRSNGSLDRWVIGHAEPTHESALTDEPFDVAKTDPGVYAEAEIKDNSSFPYYINSEPGLETVFNKETNIKGNSPPYMIDEKPGLETVIIKEDDQSLTDQNKNTNSGSNTPPPYVIDEKRGIKIAIIKDQDNVQKAPVSNKNRVPGVQSNANSAPPYMIDEKRGIKIAIIKDPNSEDDHSHPYLIDEKRNANPSLLDDRHVRIPVVDESKGEKRGVKITIEEKENSEKDGKDPLLVESRNNSKQKWSRIDQSPNSDCNIGFEMDSYGACVDIDECVTKTHQCSGLTEICRNTMGGYVCDCQNGFHRERFSGVCVLSIDYSQNASKSSGSKILETNNNNNLFFGYPNIPTSKVQQFRPTEACDVGYIYNPSTRVCEDINECLNGQARCAAVEVCINTRGGYRCECPHGWTLDTERHRCVPPNDKHAYENIPDYVTPEASINRARTHNMAGMQYNMTSSKCAWGYRQSGSGTCEDIDECADGVAHCSPVQKCVNLPGGYSCSCATGYRLGGDNQCHDIDECLAAGSVPICSQNADCVNTMGSFFCRCQKGFRSAPINEKVCVDIDECAEDSSKHLCQHRCNNVWGGYRCSCFRGFRLNDDNVTCSDIDECSEFKSNLLCVGRCVNEQGSYKCLCPAGYKLSEDKRSCIDIDECETGEAECAKAGTHGGVSHICLNTRGSYRCQKIVCPHGYKLEGKHRCTKIERVCKPGNWECAHQPTTYSYNFITFVSNLYIPSAKVDLFTMRGPTWPNASMKFVLTVVDVNAPPSVKVKATISCFELMQNNNQAVLSLIRSLEGPQSIELELSMELYSGEQFGGTAVAKLFIYVSEYEF